MLLTDILRNEWGFEGYVVSDEGAIEFIMLMHNYTKNMLETAVAAVNAGCNLELTFSLADNVFMKIKDAVMHGNITLETVKERLYPLFYTRMRLGEFDPPDMNPYSFLDLGSVQTQEHRDLAVEAAIKSFVLLKNIRDTLPLDLESIRGKRIGVIGPFADNPQELFGDYEPHPDPQYITTPKEGLAMLPVKIFFAAGCINAQCEKYNPNEIKEVVQSVDITIVCLGTGVSVETEGKDRVDLSFPGHQADLLRDAVGSAAGRPVILLLFNAGPLDVSWAQSSDGVQAILECFFPAQASGIAIAKTMVGADGVNPAGRLPVTWPARMQQVPPMENYTMHGRTYRYFGNQVPLYPFGYGLSYTKFYYSDLVVTHSSLQMCETLQLSVQVHNSGSRIGEEVAQVYISWSNASVPVPRWQLVGIQRIAVPLDSAVKIFFSVRPEQRAVWTDQWKVEPGNFFLYVGGQQPFQDLTVPSNTLQTNFTVEGKAQPLNTC
ncbi:probable beta-D-xylosidase 5 [Pelobates cultripes]|uniref:Probable beta-D-xylosidase 5 n=2 Tax=Pelobates cultripes TaxID=61616 RepID=A0AAD1R1X8_PELCU|nr:probable beta-D-xylosidase 5 [Pelobates cultripes]